jgi:hypothetical protein
MRYLRSAIASAAIILAGTGAAFAQGAGDPGASTAVKMSKADCQSIWSKADSAQNDSLTSAQAAPFVTNFKAADSNGDGNLSSAEFMSGCQRGLAHDTASSGAGAGTSGESGESAPAKRY